MTLFLLTLEHRLLGIFLAVVDWQAMVVDHWAASIVRRIANVVERKRARRLTSGP